MELLTRPGEPGRREEARGEAPRFYSVPQVARILGTAPVTLYRAIRDGEFPAVRIRGRLIVPARAIDAMIDAAIEDHAIVDASEWVVRR
jgi:excisionase family DNA binding protein